MCLILGNMKGLTYNQYTTYSNAVQIFKKVEAFNLNVSTMRSAGRPLSYYVFSKTDDESNYKMGRFILTQNDPANATSYVPVPKN